MASDQKVDERLAHLRVMIRQAVAYAASVEMPRGVIAREFTSMACSSLFARASESCGMPESEEALSVIAKHAGNAAAECLEAMARNAAKMAAEWNSRN